MTATATVYARVSLEAKQWLDEQHRKTGIPIAKIIDALLSDAARRGVSFEVRAPVIMIEPAPNGEAARAREEIGYSAQV